MRLLNLLRVIIFLTFANFITFYAYELNTDRGSIRFIKLPIGSGLMFQKDYRSEIVNFNLSFKNIFIEDRITQGALELLLNYLADDPELGYLNFIGIPIFDDGFTVASKQASLYGSYLASDGNKVLFDYLSIFFKPKWDEAKFTKVREKFIKNLKLRDSKKDNFSYLKKATLEAWFQKDSFDSNLASIDEISLLSLADLKTLHQNIFVPLNLAFSVIGATDIKQLVLPLNDLVKELPNKIPQLKAVEFKKPSQEKRIYTETKTSLVSISFAGPKLNSDEAILLFQFKRILDYGLASIFENYVEEHELINDLSFNLSEFSNRLFLDIQFKDPSNRPLEKSQAILEIFDLFSKKLISKSELANIKDASKNGVQKSLANRQELVSVLANLCLNDYNILGINDFLQVVNSITVEQVQSLFKQFFNTDLAHITTIEPLENKESKKVSNEKVSFKGAKIFLEDDPIQDMSGIAFVFKMPQAKNIAIQVLGETLLYNSTVKFLDKSVKDLHKKLDLDWKPFAINGIYSLYTSIPQEFLAKAVEFLPEVLFDRHFSQNDFNNAKAIWFSQNKNFKENYTSYQHFYKEIMPDNPISYSSLIDKELVSAISFEEVKSYLKEALRPENLNLVITGDLKSKNIKNLLLSTLEKKTSFEAFDSFLKPDFDYSKLVPVSIAKDIDSESFYYYQVDYFKLDELSLKEQAAMVMTALRFVQLVLLNKGNQEKTPEGLENISLTYLSLPLPNVSLFISGKKEFQKEFKPFLANLLLEATNFKDSEAEFDAFRKIVLYSKNLELLDRGARAINLAVYSSYNLDLNILDNLVLAIKDLKPSDLKKVLKERILGAYNLLLRPKE